MTHDTARATPTGPATPPDIHGRPREDRFMRALTAFADRYIARVASRPGSRGGTRGTPPGTPPLRLTVAAREAVADDTVALRLAAAGGGPLPRWQPGAHLDLHLPSGRIRQYSLCGDPGDRLAYRIAVRRLPDGGGGSTEIHDALTTGTEVTAQGPRNAFPFAADRSVLLLAGGIGITPVLPMAAEAARRGLDWRLVHTGRTRASLPFGEVTPRLDPARVELLTDDEHGRPDAAALLARAPAGAAVYACGPGPMLDAVRAAFDASPAASLHFERFTDTPVTDGRPFTVRLRRSGRVLTVPADRSALDVLRDADPATPYSCRRGFCGVCRQRVVSGTADHRDRRLTDAERADGQLLVCVSRAPEGTCLELDL